MSLIYDPSANNKPGKADALYLDNETYYSFFNNEDDEVVQVWELKEVS